MPEVLMLGGALPGEQQLCTKFSWLQLIIAHLLEMQYEGRQEESAAR